MVKAGEILNEKTLVAAEMVGSYKPGHKRQKGHESLGRGEVRAAKLGVCSFQQDLCL